MADLDRVRSNVKRMIDKGAPDDVISSYLSDEGVSVKQLKSTPSDLAGRPNTELRGPEPFWMKAGRATTEALGSVGGGALGMLAPPGAQVATVPLMAGAGAELGRRGFNTLMEQTGQAPPNPMTPMENLADTAITTTGQVAAGVAGPIAGVVGTKIAGKVAGSPIMGLRPTGEAQRVAQETVKAADEIGVDIGGLGPSIGGPTTKGLTQVLKYAPGSANRIRDAITKTHQSIEQSKQQLVDRYAGRRGLQTQETIGQELYQGISGRKFPAFGGTEGFKKIDPLQGKELVNARFGQQEDALINTAFGPSEGIKVDNLINVMGGQRQVFEDIPIVNGRPISRRGPVEMAGANTPTLFSKWEQALTRTKGYLTPEQLKELKSDLREMSDVPGIMRTGNEQTFLRAKTALNQDLMTAMEAKNPQAASSFRQLQEGFANEMRQFELMDSITASPTAANMVKAAMAGGKQGPEMLRQVRATVPQETFDQLTAHELANLGVNQQGKFSFPLFISGISEKNMNSQTRNILFNRPGNPSPDTQLKRLESVVKGAMGNTDFENMSKTGPFNYFRDLADKGNISRWSSAPLIAIDAVGGILPNYYIGRLMTNRDFVRWLADGVVRKAHSPNGFASHVARLSTVAAENAGIADIIKDHYLPALEEAAAQVKEYEDLQRVGKKGRTSRVPTI